MTDYERDKEYEKSEWWRVPALLISVLTILAVAVAFGQWAIK